MQYLITFFEGLITFISPCLLPMLPLYVSYFAGGDRQADTRRALRNSIGFVGGFTLVFVTLGALAGTLGSFLRLHQSAVNVVTGLMVIVFGLSFLGVIKIDLFNGKMGTVKSEKMGFASAMVFGIVFSLGWTPCVGAFLGSALMMASQQGTVLKGMLMLLAYSLGLGLPFVVSAVLIERLKGAIGWIKERYSVINKLSGALLIIIGILMATGFFSATLGSAGQVSDSNSQQEVEMSQNAEAVAAPDFTVYDASGTEHTLSEFSGKVVVVNFWASWCPPCKGEMPDFQEVYEERDGEVVFMMVNMTDGGRETVDSAREFVQSAGYTFPVYFDKDQDGAQKYGVYAIPTTYVIDANGNVIDMRSGAITKDTLSDMIDMALNA